MLETIMVVDDSSSVRQMITFTLEGAGYHAVEAKDGQEGLEKLESLTVDMIITDLNMPNMDGNAFIKAVKAMPEYKYLPIIVLTTESDASKKQAAKEAGATGWITKPFKPDQLLGIVKKVML